MPGYPPAIARAIAVSRRHFPAGTGEMEAALPVLLGPLLPVNGSARWRLSQLTDGGFPFEMTFSTASDGPRYTLEVGPGATPPGSRLVRSLELLAELGCTAAGDGTDGGIDGIDGILEQLASWQAKGPIRFGAWLGARHGGAGSAYKVYAEVPAQAQADAMAYLRSRLGQPLALPGRRQDLQLAGWYPASGDIELYGSVHGLRPWELAALMSPVGLDALAPAVLAIFEDIYGRPFGQRLPGPVFGYSYGLPDPGSGRGMSFSLFSFCEALADSDASIRRRLHSHWQRQGACMDYYTEMSGPAAGHSGPWNHHGLLGVTVTTGSAPVTHVGLRPPEAA